MAGQSEVSNSLLPVDLNGIIAAELDKHEFGDDGLLHPSTHLASNLRHAQLDRAGAPKKPRPLIERIVLHTGTMWHKQLGEWLVKNGVPVMVEVNLTPWLPKGWGGTADQIYWHPEYKAFFLTDVKTTKGESLRYRIAGGASEDHVLQASTYWHALKKMGLPLLKQIGVYYLPKNDTRSDTVIEPVMIEFDPLPVRALTAQMAERKGKVDEYLSSLPKPNPRPLLLPEFVTDALGPVQEMEQRVYFEKASGDNVLKLVPHWSTRYCDFPSELCDCSEQKSITIGRYRESGDYTPRKGFEDIEPVVTPS
jgi:hypothetical protein